MQYALGEAAVVAGADMQITLGRDGGYYLKESGDCIRFCPWCGTPLAEPIKTGRLGFDTLEFHDTSIMGDLQQASMCFENGYEVRVNADMASAGWEFAILRDDTLCGTLPSLTDKEIYRAISEEEVSELMRLVAQLSPP